MLEFKGQAADHGVGESDPSAAISPANLVRIETSRLDAAATRRGWLADFDLLGTFAALFSGWGADRRELQPIPVRIRDRL